MCFCLPSLLHDGITAVIVNLSASSFTSTLKLVCKFLIKLKLRGVKRGLGELSRDVLRGDGETRADNDAEGACRLIKRGDRGATN